jgi:hypothetical protein
MSKVINCLNSQPDFKTIIRSKGIMTFMMFMIIAGMAGTKDFGRNLK